MEKKDIKKRKGWKKRNRRPQQDEFFLDYLRAKKLFLKKQTLQKDYNTKYSQCLTDFAKLKLCEPLEAHIGEHQDEKFGYNVLQPTVKLKRLSQKEIEYYSRPNSSKNQHEQSVMLLKQPRVFLKRLSNEEIWSLQNEIKLKKRFLKVEVKRLDSRIIDCYLRQPKVRLQRIRLHENRF